MGPAVNRGPAGRIFVTRSEVHSLGPVRFWHHAADFPGVRLRRGQGRAAWRVRPPWTRQARPNRSRGTKKHTARISRVLGRHAYLPRGPGWPNVRERRWLETCEIPIDKLLSMR